MKNSLVFGLILGLLFAFMVAVGTLGLAVLFFFSARSYAPEVTVESPSRRVVASGPVTTRDFPTAPSNDGSQVEHWDGYFFYSMETFEQAIEKEVTRVHFWFDTRRKADGSFIAAANESAGMGGSSIVGNANRGDGMFTFSKTYDNGMSWRYEGRWVPERRRVEGTYGPNQGGFVLYPRRLTAAEIANIEQPGEHEVPPAPVAPRRDEQREAF